MAEEVGSLKAKVSLDTVAFNKGVKELSQKMQIISQDFKLASGGLDKLKDAAEISRLKIIKLTSGIAEQKKIVDQFRQAHQKAATEFDKGSKKALDYELKLKKAENTLQSMERELTSTTRELEIQSSRWTQLGNTLNDVGDRMKKVGDGMKNAGKKMSTSITAPILAIGAAAVAAFKDVDKGMDTIIKKTGATGETAEELEKIYKDIAGSVPDSLEDVGAAVGELNTRFDFTGDTLKKASEDFLKFARINDMDVNSSVQLVSRAMGDAGIESSEYGSVLDMLTVAAQKSGIGMDSLAENLTKYGAPMRALGLDTETSIAMFAGWEKAGVNTEIAFSGMKLAIGKWGKEGKDSTKEFEKTLKAIKDAPDITSATGMAIEIFGQRAGADLADAIKGGRFEIGEYVEALKNAGGTVESTYGGITDGTDDAKTAFNQIKVSASEFGSVIVTTLAPILKSLGEKIKEIGEWFSGLSPEMKKNILIFAGIAAAIGPVLVVVGTLISSIGAIVGLFGAASAAIAAHGGALAVLTGPIGLAALAITGLVAGGVLLVNKLRQEVIPATNLFGDETSEATKKAVTSYMDMDDKVGVSLLSFQANNTKITKNIAKDMISTFETMGTQIKAGRDKHYTEDLDNLTKFYTDQGTLNSVDSQATLAKMKKDHTDKEAAVGDFAVKIKAIYDKAATDHRELTQKEEDDVKAIKDKMQTMAIQALTESEAEQKAIFTRMRLQAKDISTLQASEVIGASGKQRDETTKLANDQYEKVVNSISRQRDEGVIASDDQATKMIAAAELTRSETVRKAGEMHTAVVEELGKQNADVLIKLNESDGSVKTHWQNLKEWFANNPLIRQIITGESTTSAGKNSTVTTNYKSTAEPTRTSTNWFDTTPKNATGTNNWRGGLTRVNEKGGEIMNLPRGTQIIPHDVSMAIAKSIGESVRGVNGGIVNVNLIVDGKTLAQVIAPYQQQMARGRSRGQGVTA